MPRIRTIKPEFWEDEKVAALPFGARLLFIALWNLADDKGRMRGASALIHRKVFPYDAEAPVAEWLDALVSNGLVRRYIADGQTYLDVPNFLKHQRIKKPSDSNLPPYSPTSSLPVPHQFPTGSPLVPPGTGNREQGKEPGREKESAEPGKPVSPPAATHIQVDGTPYHIPATTLKAWRGAFPGVRIEAECLKAHAWETANPKLRKVNKVRFLHNWLARAQDQAGRVVPARSVGGQAVGPRVMSPEEAVREARSIYDQKRRAFEDQFFRKHRDHPDTRQVTAVLGVRP